MIHKISNDGGYTWWTRPVVSQQPTNSYHTSVAQNGQWGVSLNDGSPYNALGMSPEADDHNAPSVLVRPYKPRLAFATRHSKSKVVNTFRATSGISFNSAGNLNHPGNVSYTQAMDKDDTVVVISRVGMEEWRLFRSDNWGTSWGASLPFLSLSSAHTGQFYVTTAPTDVAGVYDIAAYGHPVSSTLRTIHWGVVNLADNTISSGGSVQGALGAGLAVDQLEVAVPEEAGTVFRLLSAGRIRNTPVVTYAIIPDNGDPIRYAMRYRGEAGVWSKEIALGFAGAVFYETSKYVGGIAIADNGLYVSREVNGVWRIESIPVSTDMTPGYAGVLAEDTLPLVRPVAVEDGTGVIWQRLVKYADYRDYHIEYFRYAP